MTTTSRRRRTPEQARTEILDAAERLLRSKPLAALTVSSVMRDTTLTRNAFYAYFDDRYELVAALVTRLRASADAGLAAFADDPDGDLDLTGRAALRSAAQLYVDHGELLRALADAAHRDPAAARAWRDFAEPSVRAVAARLRAETEAGRLQGIDPEATARALVAMNRAYFFDQLVGRRDADVEAVVDTLHAIWLRVLRGSPRSGHPRTPAAGTARRSPPRTG